MVSFVSLTGNNYVTSGNFGWRISVVFHDTFYAFSKDASFQPIACRPFRPQTKGKVERLVDYVKDNFLPGRRFKDLHDLNSQALEWCRKVDSKVHGTTGEIPLEALNKEPLLPLPDKAIRDKYRWETRNVTRDGFVSYDGAKYGIPWQYSGKEVRVKRFINKHQKLFQDDTTIVL